MKNIKQPLVTVIMTAHNAERFITEALTSILNQTYKKLEIIVIDDGSTDATYMIARRYMGIDKRLKVYRIKKNVGPSLASNFALRKAHGDLIARMDADDVAISTRIEKQVKFLLRNPDIVIVGGQCHLINEHGKIIGEKIYPLHHKEIYESLFAINPIQHPSCMFRRDVLPKRSITYHNHSFLAHDLELIFEIAQYGKLANLPDAVLHYRLHNDSLSMKDPKKTFQATVEVREKAVRKYRYIPSWKGRLFHFCQMLVVYSLPNKFVYTLFQFLRIKRSISDKKSTPFTTPRSLYRLAYRWVYTFIL